MIARHAMESLITTRRTSASNTTDSPSTRVEPSLADRETVDLSRSPLRKGASRSKRRAREALQCHAIANASYKLGNFVGNALKHVAAGHPRSVKKAQRRFEFSVSDTGEGIRPEDSRTSSEY